MSVKDTTNYDVLATKAEHGELKTLRRVMDGDGSPIDLASIFMASGRPRQEEATARRTWKTRATDELDAALTAQAKREALPKSALIRKAVATYLTRAGAL